MSATETLREQDVPSWSVLFGMIGLRLRLLLRQRLGWMALLGGVAIQLLALSLARSSFMNPARIFWDFALGSSFVLQSLFVIYLSSQLYGEEHGRRTLHLLLASGVGRSRWLIGNALGTWMAVTLMNAAWLLLSFGVAKWAFGAVPWTIVLQAQGALAVEMFVVGFLGMLFSLWVRPLLSFGGTIAVVTFLHSVSSLESVFADRESGHLIEATEFRAVLQVAKFLPPLEWFDLRMLVAYQDAVPWRNYGAILLIGCLWGILLAGLAVWRFERMDL